MMATIYGLRQCDGGLIRYVGKTAVLQTRIYQHIRAVKTGVGKIAETFSQTGISPIVLELVNDADAEERERFWIGTLLDHGLDLINETGRGPRPAMLSNLLASQESEWRKLKGREKRPVIFSADDMARDVRKLNAFMERTGVTQAMLAKQADLHPNTLIGLRRKDAKPLTPKTIRALVRVIDRLETVL